MVITIFATDLQHLCREKKKGTPAELEDCFLAFVPGFCNQLVKTSTVVQIEKGRDPLKRSLGGWGDAACFLRLKRISSAREPCWTALSVVVMTLGERVRKLASLEPLTLPWFAEFTDSSAAVAHQV